MTTLELRDVHVSIGAYDILRGIDFTVGSGEIVGLVGRNGAGKTTTLRSIMGLLPVASGSITLDEVDLLTSPAHQRTKLGIGYMPEDRRLIDPLSVEQNLLVPAWATALDDTDTRLAWIYDQLPDVVHDFASRPAVYLSGGQQKLVAFGRALMTGRRLLILDEPFEGVASPLTDQLYMLLDDLRSQGVSTLIASADPQLNDLADAMITIERGEIAST